MNRNVWYIFCMKKIFFLSGLGIAVALVFFSACSSVSMHPLAYVAGTEDFVASEIEHKQLSRTISWQNYTLKLDGVKNRLSQKTVRGKGGISGTLSQHGTFFKEGAELFSTDIFNEVEGIVLEDKRSRDTLTDSVYRIETGIAPDGGKYVFRLNRLNTTEDGAILQDSQGLPFAITEIPYSINEHGKIYKMWLGAAMGISVEVDGELLAVVDYYHNPPQVRENPGFSKTLSDGQKDVLASLMLMLLNYDVSFRSVELDASSKIDIR